MPDTAAPAKPRTVPAPPATPAAPPPPVVSTPVAPTTPDLCGKSVVKKNKDGKETGESAPCIKARGHDKDSKSKCSWRAYTKIDTSVVGDDALDTLESVPTSEELTDVQGEGRSERQIKVDDHVKQAHEAWIKAGKPKGINAAIKANCAMRYRVTDENVAGFRTMLRAACNVHRNVWVRMAPVKRNVDGSKMLYWYAPERIKRENKKDSKK